MTDRFVYSAEELEALPIDSVVDLGSGDLYTKSDESDQPWVSWDYDWKREYPYESYSSRNVWTIASYCYHCGELANSKIKIHWLPTDPGEEWLGEVHKHTYGR